MIDPSAVANIITFINAGVKVTAVAIRVYRAASGATAENANHEARVIRSGVFLEELVQRRPSGELCKMDAAIYDLAQRCSEVSTEFRAVLEKIKARKSKSVRATLAVLLRMLWNRRRWKSLAKDFRECWQELNNLLAMSARFSFEDKLSTTINAQTCSNAELQAIRGNIGVLQSALTVTRDAMERLGIERIEEIISRSQRVEESVRQRRVLNGLWHEGMTNKFDAVTDPCKGTFQWLLQGEAPDTKAAVDAHLSPEIKACRVLVAWAAHGNGILPIYGKFGSGKSTLMKFLSTHKGLKQRLKVWAEEDRKALVIGSFFFHKAGNPSEKTVTGMVRGLLFSLATCSPDLIESLFPTQWNESIADERVVFRGSRDILAAFARLINSDRLHSQYRFALFIDGLDEVESTLCGTEDTVKQAVEKLKEWTTNREEDVKICLSYRSDPIIRAFFGPEPQIQLDRLTRRDIAQLVMGTLGQNSDFQRLGDESERKQITDQIINDSSGVFLWTRLVIRAVEEGLGYGDTTLNAVKRKVESLPREFDALLSHLLKSIRPADMEEAYAILTMVRVAPREWPLFRFSFVHEYLQGADPPFKRFSDDDLRSRLSSIRQKITGKCRGLLEVTESSRFGPGTGSSMVRQTFHDRVEFTHRSIGEFIARADVGEGMLLELEKYQASRPFDPLYMTCQTLLAHLKSVPLDEYVYGYGQLNALLDHSKGTPLSMPPPPSFEREILQLLKMYESHANPCQRSNFPVFLSNALNSISSTQGVVRGPMTPPQSYGHVSKGLKISFQEHIMLIAAFYGFTDHVSEIVQTSPERARVHVAVMCSFLLLVPEDMVPRVRQALEFYFDNGIQPNDPLPGESCMCWSWFLGLLMKMRRFAPTLPNLWRGQWLTSLAFLVKKGADINVDVCLTHDRRCGSPYCIAVRRPDNAGVGRGTSCCKGHDCNYQHEGRVKLVYLVERLLQTQPQPLQDLARRMLTQDENMSTEDRAKLLEAYEAEIETFIDNEDG